MTLMSTLGKFVGACNSVKSEMDRCFRKEKEEKRDINLRKAREFEAKFTAETGIRLNPDLK